MKDDTNLYTEENKIRMSKIDLFSEDGEKHFKYIFWI